MSIVAIGLDHTTAALDLRSRFAVPAGGLGATLHDISRHLRRSAEVAIVSTCNRTELYLSGLREHAEGALDWLATLGGTSAAALRAHSYQLEDGSAARHAFRVASGLDSMVLGETQIFGQFKQAVREAEQAGTLGSTLQQLFQRSFAVAKEVRSRTRIGEHSVSLAAASVRLAGDLFDDLGDTRVLLVGAGEMIELAGLHYAARRPAGLTVANRTLDRAIQLADRLGGDAMALADVPRRLGEFDIVVSCTASTLPVIGLGAVESALRARRRRPMFLVDLAVPRDIEPEVARLPDAYLCTLDDLSHVVQDGQALRQAAVRDAEAIIETGVRAFEHWLQARSAVPLIQDLNRQTDEWRRLEIARAQRLLAKGSTIDDALECLARGLTQKLLHGAICELQTAEGEERERLGRTMTERLFCARRSAS